MSIVGMDAGKRAAWVAYVLGRYGSPLERLQHITSGENPMITELGGGYVLDENGQLRYRSSGRSRAAFTRFAMMIVAVFRSALLALRRTASSRMR